MEIFSKNSSIVEMPKPVFDKSGYAIFFGRVKYIMEYMVLLMAIGLLLVAIVYSITYGGLYLAYIYDSFVDARCGR